MYLFIAGLVINAFLSKAFCTIPAVLTGRVKVVEINQFYGAIVKLMPEMSCKFRDKYFL